MGKRGGSADDSDSDTKTSTWRYNDSNEWWTFATNTSISTGTNITQTNSNFSNNSATYYWSVNLTDGCNWTNATYHFTTVAGDTTKPVSTIDEISPYTITTSTKTITATASDSGGGSVANVIA